MRCSARNCVVAIVFSMGRGGGYSSNRPPLAALIRCSRLPLAGEILLPGRRVGRAGALLGIGHQPKKTAREPKLAAWGRRPIAGPPYLVRITRLAKNSAKVRERTKFGHANCPAPTPASQPWYKFPPRWRKETFMRHVSLLRLRRHFFIWLERLAPARQLPATRSGAKRAATAR